MASSEQIREWFHDGVVLNHHQRGSPGYKPTCNHSHPTVNIPKDGGGVWVRAVHPLATEAWNAYIAVMIHHGESMPSAGGVGNCRNIANTNMPSLHAYLCALDIPPNGRKSSAFIGDMGRIRTDSGAFVFRNLAGDRMHDQINCSPAHLASGIDWSTVIGGDDNMAWADVYKKWDAADINEMSGKGLFDGAASYWINDIGTYAHDWDHFTAIVLSADAALPPKAGPKGDDGEDGKDGDPGLKGDPGDDGKGLEPGDTIKLGSTATVL